MLESFPITTGDAVFGKGEFTYQQVLDDFGTTSFIGILTFNISPKSNSRLLEFLKKACSNGTNAVIVTNVPKRYPSYYDLKYEYPAKKMISLYKSQLNPRNYGMRLSPYFTFKNHAKVIVTDNLVYLGSSNFSDESSENLECGIVSSDKELIEYVKDTLFPDVQSHAVPYYKDNFAVAIANLEDLIPICQEARQALFNAAYIPWSDYDTNFEERWIYQTTDNGVTVEFLRHFQEVFSGFEDALDVIDEILDDYWDQDDLPDEVEKLQELYEQYKSIYDQFLYDISSLFDGLEEMAHYDVNEEANRKIYEDYSMEAYDEHLNYYAEKAFQEASDEYEELIKEAKTTTEDALKKLDEMVAFFTQIMDALNELLQVDKRIDNTHI